MTNGRLSAKKLSGPEFLDSMGAKGETMGLPTGDAGTYRRRRELDIEDARRGDYRRPNPVEIDADIQLETLSSVIELRATVSRQWSSILQLERMVRFLVENVEAPKTTEPKMENSHD
jgi:hypothetical protein